MQSAVWLGSAQWIVRCLRLRADDAFSSYREDDSNWMDAWRVQQSSPASRRDTLISHLFADREPAPEFLEHSPRRSGEPALRSDQPNRRSTEKLQILSWIGPLAQRGDQTRVHWQATSTVHGT